MMKLNFTYSDELYHYGVKGMRWGVRRVGSYSGKPRHTGGSGGRSGMSAERKAKIKKAAKITAGVAGTAALAYGAHKFAKSSTGRKMIGDAKSKFSDYIREGEAIMAARKVNKNDGLGTTTFKYVIPRSKERSRSQSARLFLNANVRSKRPKGVRYSRSAVDYITDDKRWYNSI